MNFQNNDKVKQLKTLKSLEMSPDIDEMICLASKKLYPIIEILVESSNKNEHFLTSNEFDDIILAAKLIKDVTKALKYADIETNIRNLDFSLENYEVSFNEEGKIYVETVLLLQLIDLYNNLEDIKDVMEEFYRSIGIHSFVQTESGFSISSHESNPNKIVLRLTKPLTKSSTSFGLLQNDFIVMPSATDINTDELNSPLVSPIRQSKSDLTTSLKNNSTVPTKRINSTGSFIHEEISEVTDVYGAKRVVVRCICDLEEVSKYLGTPRKDVATICSRADVADNMQTSPRRKSNVTEKSYESGGLASLHNTEEDHACCCPECFAELGSGTDFQECDDDKVIICIKGCNEDEGDVQIVIRQCPDCRKAEGSPRTPSDKYMPSEIPPKKSLPSDTLQLQKSEAEKMKQRSHEDEINPDVKELSAKPPKVDEKTDDEFAEKVESSSLHNKDSQESYVCSDESEEKVPDKIESPVKMPESSLDVPVSDGVEQKERVSVSSTPAQSLAERPETNIQQQVRVSCSTIRLFETTNLCLQTDTGQELVISLTVTPKNFNNKKLSLRDIFSEDDYADQEKIKIKDEPGKSDGQSSDKERSSVRSGNASLPTGSVPSGSKESDKLEQFLNQPADYYVEDRVIPLARTKICSSVDFDVTTFETKLREKGFNHKNNKIVVQLRELGIDNLLRACRPAKCCRKAVLNEKMKKCLPYPPSLRSLPLDDEDMHVINQSLQMSLQKVKNSTNLKEDFYKNDSYFAKPIQTIMYFFVETCKQNTSPRNDATTQKLSYYINLVNDIEFKPQSKYDILYFGIKKETDKLCSGNEINSNSDFQNIGVNMIQVESNPYKCNKSNYKNYEDRPMLTGFYVDSKNSFKNMLMSNESNLKTAQIPNKEKEALPDFKNKKRFISKIPIYKRNVRSRYFDMEINNALKKTGNESCDISMDSLPEEQCSLKGMLDVFDSKLSFPNHNEFGERELLTKIPKQQKIDLLKNFESSRLSIINNYSPKRGRRKKKIFYLSRSRSDISLKTLQNFYKHRTSSSLSKNFPRNPDNLGENDKKELNEIYQSIVKEDRSKLILDYFSKILYKMAIRETIKEKIFEHMSWNKYNKETSTELRENKSLLEIYNRSSYRNNSIHNELKAKKSQSCILVASKSTKKHICILNNLSLQTSVIYGETKQCQTSTSLLAYFLESNKNLDGSSKRKRMFSSVYNSEGLNGIPNSCNEFEKFIVVFKSEESLKSNLSDKKDIFSINSQPSKEYQDYLSDQQTLSESLLMLKETLENYESVKNEITRRSVKESNINPIEYFVYQMCACNKFNKKPSMMQKILSKTKGLFTSMEHDMSFKNKNQRHFPGMSSADKKLCHRCGCFISKCSDNANNKMTEPSSSCQCPPENRSATPSSQPCCKKRKSSDIKPNKNLSRITSSSISSLKSIKTCLKRSFTNALTRGKDKSLGPCVCDKEIMVTNNASTICVPPGVKVVDCQKKDISTGTVSDSTTQKCDCDKCENYTDDGTCCCSHCLGCLDKSSDAKPESKHRGTLCDCAEVSSKSVDKSSGKINNEISVKKDDDIKTSNTSNTKFGENSKNSSATNGVGSAKVASEKSINADLSSIEDSNNYNDEKSSSAENNYSGGVNTDTTSFYLVTAPPNLFTHFSFENRNPFDQRLLNFPNVNMFCMNGSRTFLND